MPRAEILSTQAMHTLRQLHSELAGKLLETKSEAKRLTTSMLQVEAVMKLLEPGYDVRPIAIRRRTSNPWFRRGTIFRTALETLRRASGPLTAREMAEAMLAAKGITGTPHKAVRDLAGSIQASLQNNNGKSVQTVGEGMPVRWRLIG